MTGLRRQDVVLSTDAHVRCMGKGRKERCTPLTKQAVGAVKKWLQETPLGTDSIVFPNVRGARLSADGVRFLLAKHVATAQQQCPSLKSKRVTPHVLRHTAAMELLQAGVDRSVIALWLGHESIETTQMYLDADLRLKETALSKTTPLADDPLIKWDSCLSYAHAQVTSVSVLEELLNIGLAKMIGTWFRG